MKTKHGLLSGLAVLFAAAVFTLTLAGCPTGSDSGEAGYEGFYNYPTGRVDTNNGRLTIENTIAGEVLLFAGKMSPDSYIGTVGSLSRVKVKLTEEKFHTIIAVDKANYAEQKEQAEQFSSLTYYSNSQPYTISVSPSSTYGGGRWVFNNNTDYWVEVKKTDKSENYAVIAPKALQVTVPVAMGSYPYSLNSAGK